MDIITHAVVGAFAGLPAGHPVIGAIIAVLPDVVLGFRRKPLPTRLYRATHGVVLPTLLALAVWAALDQGIALTVWLAWVSHIVLDVYTHGPTWSPRVLYPFSDRHCSKFAEWEFGNDSWKDGLFYAFLMIGLFIWFSVLGHIW